MSGSGEMWYSGCMKKVVTDAGKIDAILNRGVIVEVLPSKDAFREKLLSGDRIRMYIGADPTSTSLHLSHAKNYLLLEEFRQLGHEVIVLFGDFTARIGDPSGREGARKQLFEDEIEKNVDSWLKQIRPLMKFDDAVNPPSVRYNSEWLTKLKFDDVLRLAANFTVQQMIERDMFQKRLQKGDPIYLHEFLYPLMQAYDSVAMDVDAELCGTDQTFNALAGRTLLKYRREKDKFVVIVNLLEDPATGELMSKSKSKGVFLNTSPEELYGAVMAQSDEMIRPLLINLTRISLREVDEILKQHPRNAKQRAAKEITVLFHGENIAKQAEEAFVGTFQKKEVPADIAEITAAKDAFLADVLVKEGLVSSKSEFRRLVEAGAIESMDTNENITDSNITVTNGMTLKIGKRRFVKIVAD